MELATEPPSLAEINDAIAATRAAGPSKVVAELLMARAGIERQRRELGATTPESTLDEALSVSRITGDVDLIAEAMWQRAFVKYWFGDLDGMHRHLLEALEYVRTAGSNRAGRILFFLARNAAYRGEFTQAGAFDAEAIAALPYSSKFFRAVTHVTRSRTAIDVGDFSRFRQEARQANALFRELGLPAWIAGTNWAIGEASLELGDAEEARRVLEEAADLYERMNAPGQIPEVRARLARALVLLGDVPRARKQAEIARDVALPHDVESRYIAAVALGEVCEAEGDPGSAAALLGEAVAMLEPSGEGDRLATARIYYARFLLRQGRAQDARTQLDQARAFYRDPLAERHRERIDLLLRQAATRTA